MKNSIRNILRIIFFDKVSSRKQQIEDNPYRNNTGIENELKFIN